MTSLMHCFGDPISPWKGPHNNPGVVFIVGHPAQARRLACALPGIATHEWTKVVSLMGPEAPPPLLALGSRHWGTDAAGCVSDTLALAKQLGPGRVLLVADAILLATTNRFNALDPHQSILQNPMRALLSSPATIVVYAENPADSDMRHITNLTTAMVFLPNSETGLSLAQQAVSRVPSFQLLNNDKFTTVASMGMCNAITEGGGHYWVRTPEDRHRFDSAWLASARVWLDRAIDKLLW